MTEIETKCKICGVPMTIKVELSPLYPSGDRLAEMATCDPCLERRFRKKVKPAAPAPEKEQNLPYKD